MSLTSWWVLVARSVGLRQTITCAGDKTGQGNAGSFVAQISLKFHHVQCLYAHLKPIISLRQFGRYNEATFNHPHRHYAKHQKRRCHLSRVCLLFPTHGAARDFIAVNKTCSTYFGTTLNKPFYPKTNSLSRPQTRNFHYKSNS